MKPRHFEGSRLPRVFWIYLGGSAPVAAGFADFSLIAFHFEKASIVPNLWIPIFYSTATATSGAGSLLFGRWFDRAGIWILVPLTILSAASAAFVFLGHFPLAILAIALWAREGVHESIIPAAVATMVPAERRASAYGFFTAGYGLFWFLGSVMIGRLYEVSLPALLVFSIGAQLLAIPIFLAVRKMQT